MRVIYLPAHVGLHCVAEAVLVTVEAPLDSTYPMRMRNSRQLALAQGGSMTKTN